MNEEYEIELKGSKIKNIQEPKMKIYTQPKITKLGAMQRVTLGGSIGPGDSGNNVDTELTII